MKYISILIIAIFFNGCNPEDYADYAPDTNTTNTTITVTDDNATINNITDYVTNETNTTYTINIENEDYIINKDGTTVLTIDSFYYVVDAKDGNYTINKYEYDLYEYLMPQDQNKTYSYDYDYSYAISQDGFSYLINALTLTTTHTSNYDVNISSSGTFFGFDVGERMTFTDDKIIVYKGNSTAIVNRFTNEKEYVLGGQCYFSRYYSSIEFLRGFYYLLELDCGDFRIYASKNKGIVGGIFDSKSDEYLQRTVIKRYDK